MESSDTNVSVDNISLPPKIVQEVDKNTDRYIWTNSSKGNDSIPYRSLERGQNSVKHEATVLPTRDLDENPPYQQARNRRDSESSGSDNPEEERCVNSNEALASSLDNIEHCKKSRGGVEDGGPIKPKMFNLSFDQSDNTDDGQCTDSFVVSCQGAEHKMSFALSGWSATKTNQVVRMEMNQPMQEEEYGDGGSISKKPVCFPELRDFIQRQATFGNWTKKLPHKDNLANAGLFYKGITKDAQGEDITDMVYCYKCGKSLMNFEEDDDPQNEHDRLLPECRNTNWY